MDRNRGIRLRRTLPVGPAPAHRVNPMSVPGLFPSVGVAGRVVGESVAPCPKKAVPIVAVWLLMSMLVQVTGRPLPQNPATPAAQTLQVELLGHWPASRVVDLAGPYLLNPAGIAVLVIASGDIAEGAGNPLISMAVLVALVLILGLLDLLVFTNLDKLSKYLDPHRLAVTEAVFGVLLAALAIQLMLDGLAERGIIDMLAH